MNNFLAFGLNFCKEILPYSLKEFEKQQYTQAKKKDGSTITEIDTTIEKKFRSAVKKTFPGHGIIGEEFATITNNQSDYQRVIDPIDGTRDFSRKIPFRATLIALMHKGKVIVGISSMPKLHETVYASLNEGARTYDHDTKCTSQCFVSKRGRENAYLAHARTVHFQENKKRNRPDLLQPFFSAINKAWYHKNGRAYELHLLAQGKIDAFISPDSKFYDNAPFHIIVTEAGGKISTFNGGDITRNDTSTIASNAVLHEDIVSTFAPYR